MRATPKPEQGYTGVNLPTQGPLTTAELMAFFNNLANAGFTFHDDGTDTRPEYLNALPNALWAKTDGENKKTFFLYDGIKDNLLWTINSDSETNNIVFNQSINIATKEALGAIKIGEGLNVNSDGLLNLQIANEENLGGIKLSKKDFNINPDGLVSLISGIPVGIPQPWPTATAPDGWLICMGQIFDILSYPELAKAYPSGTLPDLRGTFIRGWDNGRNFDGGRVLLSYQVDATQVVTGGVAINGMLPMSGAFIGGSSAGHTLSGNTVGINLMFNNAKVVRTAIEERVKNVAFNYIVQAK